RYHNRAKLSDDPQDSPLNSNFKDSEDISISSNFEDSNENDNFEDLSFNYDNLEDDNVASDFVNSSDDLGDVLINNIRLEDSDDNSNIGLENSDIDISINDDGLSNQKIADRPEPFKPNNGKYGPYFANFTEQENFLWTLQTRMPLLNVKSYYIPIDDRRTSFTSRQIKPVYTISIKEHLKHVLNNLRLMKKMYFGCGIESQEKSSYGMETFGN
ncbi:20140_t:CDS:2, partial [Racocetra persica]